jgi:poly(A) polymerase
MAQQPTWLDEKPLQQFFAASVVAGGQARAVGGCVRDFLLGFEGADIDLASTLTPEKNIEIAAQHGWKAIPTGIDHGTVTIVLPGRVVEVTTLRRDVTTDGRRATVAYTDNWQEDAARRDFTMNALFMDASGKIYDFFDGKNDIAARRVAFIGDASTRIEEDALRILRYFRFLATHGKPPADATALAAISAKKSLIKNLSGERIANEMRKLLAADNPAYVLRLMAEHDTAPLIFGRAMDASRMIRLQLLESQADYQTSVWARVICLMTPPPGAEEAPTPPPEGEVRCSTSVPQARPSVSDEAVGSRTSPSRGEVARSAGGGDIDWITQRWKLARHEAKQLTQLASLPAFDAHAPRHAHTRILRLNGAPAYLDLLLTQAATTPGIDIAPYVALAHDFTPPTFPITAKDLMARGMKEGKALGDALAELEKKWEESDYTLTKEALLDTSNRI